MAADSPLAGVMDNPYYDWSPLVTRPRLNWPGGANVALGVMLIDDADGAETSRLLLLNVHPWLTGRPFRIKYFAEVVGHIRGHAAIWKATGAKIADWYRSATVPA